jgi:hypothetical protein
MCDIEITLMFVPSSLGSNNHKAEIIFFNQDQVNFIDFYREEILFLILIKKTTSRPKQTYLNST